MPPRTAPRTKRTANASSPKPSKPPSRAPTKTPWLILFAHGAGAPSTSAWMRAWKTRLATLGAVVTFDYPYMRAGRKRPDPHDTLLEAHREALRAARKAHPGLRVALVGKSMGSRIGCHLALEEPVDAIVCLGYPLVSPGKSKAMRDEVLLASKTPILFVQGTRDAFCPLDVLARVRKKMRAPNDLYVVETGNHSLEITAARARAEDTTQPRVDDAIRDHIAGFLEGRG